MSIRIIVASATTAPLMIFLLPGCHSKTENGPPADEVVEQAYKVTPNPSVRITHIRGSVSITGVDTSEVRMRAVKSAPSAARLKDITVSVSAEPGDVLIKTAFLREKKMPFFAGTSAVDYTLSVPRNATIARLDLDDGKVSIDGIQDSDVRANVVDGELAIRNCCGNIKVAVANGELNLDWGRCEGPRFSADAQVVNGNARLSIARGASVRVRAETLNGKIVNNLADPVQLNSQSAHKIDISFGAGRRSDITLRVTSGDITLVPAESGR
jgi:DUF4097 and DUF4098 domain-containing protein YvlB